MAMVGSIQQGKQHLVRASQKNGRFISPFLQPYLDSPLLDHVKVWRTRKIPPPLKFSNGVNPDSLIKVQPAQKDALSCPNDATPQFTWMGHASCYYQSDGIRFLTDPVFSERCSPSQLVGPKRIVPPPCAIDDLDIDVVLLSHTHYDHLDYNTAKKIGNKSLWIVPLGVKEWLSDKCNIDNVIELNWWESISLTSTHSPLDGMDHHSTSSSTFNATNTTNTTNSAHTAHTSSSVSSSTTNNNTTSSTSSTSSTLGPSLFTASSTTTTQVTLTPAKHWTKRTFFDQNQCLWGGFAVRSQSSSWYFSGDTAWDDQLFKTIGHELGPFDFASIGIGCYEPREVMRDSHTSPSEALDIFHDVGAERMMGMHWGTWKLADEANVEPAFDLGVAREQKEIDHDVAFTMNMGETIELNNDEFDGYGQNDVVHRHPDLFAEYKNMDRGEKIVTTSLIDSPHFSISI